MSGAAPVDRRQRRRLETIEQVLDVAVDVMAEQGVAGLTLGEVARRMGIRPPSLYVYFDSKRALYDALFERGWRLLLHVVQDAVAALDRSDPVADFHDGTATFVRWAVEHPPYSALMFWRPVPGFVPSASAFAPALALSDIGRAEIGRLRDLGILPPGTDVERAHRTYTSVLAGVISQQLSNAPEEPFETGTFTAVLPDLLGMWLAHHGAARGAARLSRGVPS